MKKQFVKPEIKGVRLRENILAGSGQQVAGCGAVCEFNCPEVNSNPIPGCPTKCQPNIHTDYSASRSRMSF